MTAANFIITKLQAGHTIKGKEHKITDNDTLEDMKLLLQAVHQKAVDERKRMDKDFAAAAAGGGPPGQAPSGPLAAPAKTETKKQYPPLRFHQRVEIYNKKQINGHDRCFPVKQLLGAHETLIRLEEESTTKMHTPVGLGEILATRLFTSFDTMNKNSATLKRSDKDFEVSVADTKDGQKEVTVFGQKKSNFSPNSSQLIQDGAIAAGWALKLFEVGEEPEVDSFILWFITLVRKYPGKLWAVKDIWDRATWNIALRMQEGIKFGQAADEAMTDKELKDDCLSASPPKGEQTNRSRAWQGKGGTKDGSPKKKKKGDGKGKGQKRKGQPEDKDEGGRSNKRTKGGQRDDHREDEWTEWDNQGWKDKNWKKNDYWKKDKSWKGQNGH